MASVFGHGIVAATIAKLSYHKTLKWLVLLAIASSVLPDIDVITFRFGIPYEHPFGHRGFTHSITFALAWAIMIAFTIGKKNKA